jgi:hypothetical protein
MSFASLFQNNNSCDGISEDQLKRMGQYARIQQQNIPLHNSNNRSYGRSFTSNGSSFPRIEDVEDNVNNGKFVKIRMEEENVDINLLHPVLVGKIIQQYFNGHSHFHKVYRGIIVKTKDYQQFKNVMTLKRGVYVKFNNEDKKIVFEEQLSKNISKGIIFDESLLQMEESEILNELKNQGYNVKEVKNLTKRNENGNIIRTNGFIVTLNEEKLPDKLKFCGMLLKIRQYYPFVRYCKNCLSFLHKSEDCKQQFSSCKKCGNPHLNDQHICYSLKCPNCPEGSNDHAPNSRNCPAMLVEKEIVQVKIDKRVSFSKAKSFVFESLTKQTKKSPWNPPLTKNSNEGLEKELEDKTLELEKAKSLRQKLQKINEALKDELKQIEILEKENYNLNRELERHHKKIEKMVVDKEEVEVNKPRREAESFATNSKLSPITYQINGKKVSQTPAVTPTITPAVTPTIVYEVQKTIPPNFKAIGSHVEQQLIKKCPQFAMFQWETFQKHKDFPTWYEFGNKLIPIIK